MLAQDEQEQGNFNLTDKRVKMETRQDIQFDLSKTIEIIVRRKWLILAMLLGILSLVAVYNQLATPIYKAGTTIVFEELNTPTASISSFKIAFNKNFIIKQIEEIKSRSLAEEVVNALPEDVKAMFPLPEKLNSDFNHERFIADQIRKGITVSSINESEVIVIEVAAYTPLAAEVIANTIAEVLKKRKMAIKQEESSQVREIIESQLVNFKQQLDSAETALKDFKEQSKVTVINQEAEEIFKRITEAEVAYNQARANLDAAEKRFSFIQEKLARERQDLVPSITKITSPWAQKLKEQLVDLEVQYTTLKLQDYPENHPKMQQLQKQIGEAKENLKTESLKIAAGESIIDPISQIEKLMEESVTLEIEIQTYLAQEQALRNVIYGYEQNLSTLPDKELHLAQLLRNKEVNESIYTMLLKKREESKIAEAEKVGNIRIIDAATAPTSPIKPRKSLNLIIGFIFGLMSSFSLIFFLEIFDKSIKTVEDVEQLEELSVLGIIPKISLQNLLNTDIDLLKDKRAAEIACKMVSDYNPRSPESEAFRNLRASLQLKQSNSPIKTLLITSANPGEGKSLIVSNLGIITAQMGLRTLIIDADLKKPVLHKVFQKKIKPGLTDIVVTNVFMSAVYDVIAATHFNNLDILTSGTIPLASSEVVASGAIKDVLAELKYHYDIILIDTPPINIVADAGILNACVDGSLLVVRSGGTSMRDMKTAIKLLNKTRDNTVGVVLNYKDFRNGYSKNHYYYLDGSNGTRVRENRRVHMLTLA